MAIITMSGEEYLQGDRLYFTNPHNPDSWSESEGEGRVISPTFDIPPSLEDILRDLRDKAGEPGISWTHAAAFIRMVEHCPSCSQRIKMVLDRLFEISDKEEKEWDIKIGEIGNR